MCVCVCVCACVYVTWLVHMCKMAHSHTCWNMCTRVSRTTPTILRVSMILHSICTTWLAHSVWDDSSVLQCLLTPACCRVLRQQRVTVCSFYHIHIHKMTCSYARDDWLLHIRYVIWCNAAHKSFTSQSNSTAAHIITPIYAIWRCSYARNDWYSRMKYVIWCDAAHKSFTSQSNSVAAH